jgi:hypothetical protein
MIANIIIKSWAGTLEHDDESAIRNIQTLAEALSCEDHQYAAAQVVFRVSTFTPPHDLSKKEAIDKARWIASGGRKGRWG